MQLFIFSIALLCCIVHPSTGRVSIEEQWQEDKLKALYDMVSRPLDIGTVTVVGWQYIHDEQGNVKEIKTLEITLDTPEKTKERMNMMLLDFDSDLDPELPYFIDELHEDKNFSKNFFGSKQSWDIGGNLKEMFLVDSHDIWKAGDDNDIYAMRNMTVKNLDDVKNIAEKHALASVLVANPDGSFNEKESVIMPELQAYITSNSKGTQEMLEEALKAVTNSYLKHKTTDDILESMTKTMSKEFPAYKWILTNENDGSYSNRDVHIGVSYTLIGLHEQPVEIDLFAIKKE